jgi:hypothetical protein
MRPYLIGATIVSVLAFLMGIFLLPKASEGFNNFRYNYLTPGGLEKMRENSDVFRQTSKDEYIYVGSFNQVSKMAFNFSMEKFDKDQLKYKITASRIKWNPLKKNYTLYDYTKRKVGKLSDEIEIGEKKDTVFSFDLEDLTPMVYVAETLSILELNHFIDKEIKRGYNQATILSKGISNVFQIPVDEKSVSRNKATATQTRKDRTERWLNVDQSFIINDRKAIEGKHILLVDDVITTGATLEACGNIILQIPNTQLSIATLAQAVK